MQVGCGGPVWASDELQLQLKIIQYTLNCIEVGGVVASRLDAYLETLAGHVRNTEVTDRSGRTLTLDHAIDWMRKAAHETHDAGNKIVFVGNGGSSSIASHLAIDFSKNGMRAQAFNDAAARTCLGNDLGFENVFAKQIDLHARPGDLMVFISSSGKFPTSLPRWQLHAAAIAGS